MDTQRLTEVRCVRKQRITKVKEKRPLKSSEDVSVGAQCSSTQ